MPTPSSQGSTCSFNGSTIGSVTRFRAAPGSAVYAEKTNITSTVVGEGAEARILKTYDCVAIDPGTIEVTLYGCPPYVYGNLGDKGLASFTFSGGSISMNAYLDSFDVVGQVGQFLVGQATFRISGD